MCQIRAVVKEKFLADERVREAASRCPVQRWALEAIALVAGVVALIGVLG